MPEGTFDPIEQRRSPVPKWSGLSPDAALPTLQRQWRLIILTVVVVTGLAAVAVWLIPPRYTSEMTLLFESKRNVVEPDIEKMMEGRPQDDPTIIGEIQVIGSRNLAKRVVRTLSLDQDPEFAGSDPDERNALAKAVHAIKAFLIPDKRGQDFVIDSFLGGLRVTQIAGSPALSVRFTSSDAEKSARILDTLAESFMVSRLEDRVENAKLVGNWLAEHIQSMRTQLEAAERNVAQYRMTHGLVAGERTALINERISKLSVELAEATAARQTAEARLQQANASLKKPDPGSLNHVINSELIIQLRQRQVELEQRAAELGESLGSRHPQMIDLQAERHKLASELRAEISRLAGMFEYDARVARAREQGLSQQLEAAKQELGTADKSSVGLRSLEREAESSRLSLERFMNLATQIRAQSDVEALLPNMRVISTANVPDRPSFPRPVPLLVVALLASLGLGVLLALLADNFSRRSFVSAEEVEATTRLPVLALVPLLRGRWRANIAERVLDPQPSVFTEAISALFTRMMLMHRTNTEFLSSQSEIKSVALTSVEPGEGKSTIALALARQQARAGRRVVLLDADFAQSRLAVNSDLPPQAAGLAEVLLGRASIDEVILQDAKSPLDLVLPGSALVDHSALATSPRIKNVVAQLRDRYDFVLIDTQPVMATAHAYQFAAAADFSVLVVRWGSTPRRQVAYALHQLRLLGCNVTAVVLSMVNIGKSRRYGYGDSGFYSDRMKRYYTGAPAAS